MSEFHEEAGLQPESRAAVGRLAPAGKRGVFVTFEGIEGSGKTTQVTRLADRLLSAGEDVLVTREPGGSPLGRRLRALLLEDRGQPIDPLAELHLYVADRIQHIREVVEPALAQGRVVLCDRFADATAAYQGYGRGLGAALVAAFHRHAPLDLRPDRTILFDLEPETGLERARSRNLELGTQAAEGRFESERIEFHRRVRDGYLALAAAEPFRFRIVAAEQDLDAVEARVADLLADLFPCLDVEGFEDAP
jgi:dTMP kinase